MVWNPRCLFGKGPDKQQESKRIITEPAYVFELITSYLIPVWVRTRNCDGVIYGNKTAIVYMKLCVIVLAKL